MDENLGDQAMQIADSFSSIQNNIGARAISALRTKAEIDKNQKEDLTKIWADELVKNPNAKMPDDLPHGVKFASKVLAMKYNTDFETLDRQRFAKEAETYSQDLDAGLAAVSSGAGRDFYKIPVLRALSRIRDGRSEYKDLGNGKWEYTNNSTGKREQIDEPDAKWLKNYILAYRDVKSYLAAKIKETNWERDRNEKVMLKGGTEYYGKDGISVGTVYKGYAKPNQGFGNLIVVTGPDGVERKLEKPEDIKWFYNNFDNLDKVKARSEIKKIGSDIMTIDGKQMSKKDAMAEISMLSKQVLPGDDDALTALQTSMAKLESGIPVTEATKAEVKRSAYAKAKDIFDKKRTGWKAASRLIKLIDAFVGEQSLPPTTADFEYEASIKKNAELVKEQNNLKKGLKTK